MPLINACYALDSSATRKRETEELQEAMNTLNHTESWLITCDEEETTREAGTTIYAQPL